LKCCQSTEIDIITFDLSQRLPVKLRPAILAQAVDHGIYFEVCLSQGFKDALARRIFISNVTELVKVTRGKNILFTSGASTSLSLRAPYDFINLYDFYTFS
jgi:ribonuclease P/MRP protein subunit RPP1